MEQHIMITCDVEHYHSALLVTFEDGSDILLQSDYELLLLLIAA